MVQFLIHRLLIAILVAITVTVIGFGLLRVSGDLAAELAGDEATEAGKGGGQRHPPTGE